jgi:hypothetical protein
MLGFSEGEPFTPPAFGRYYWISLGRRRGILGSVRGPYAVDTLHRLQVGQTAYGQPLFVLLASIDHPVNMLREDLSCLHDHRLIT